MMEQGADEKLLKCSPNVNAVIRIESLFEVDVRSGSRKLDKGNKSESCINTRRCNWSLSVFDLTQFLIFLV